MEQIKKKMASLKEEKEAAIERAEDAEKAKKEAEDQQDKVSKWHCIFAFQKKPLSLIFC